MYIPVNNNKQYKGFKLKDIVHRPNALKILDAPSRICGYLCYPDGTKKPIASKRDYD